MTMLNFCINFLNKAEKSLPILYDFAVAPLTGAWIKIFMCICFPYLFFVAPLTGAWIKITRTTIVTSMPIIASSADAWIKMDWK